MPVITIDGPEMEPEVKKELIKRLTEAAADVIPNIPKEAYTVYIRGYAPESVGVAGMPLLEFLELQKGKGGQG